MTTENAERTERGGGNRLLARITRLEWGGAAPAALVLAALTVAEPEIVDAPFENSRTAIFTFGGTAAAAVALFVMLRLRVHPVARLLALGVPFVVVSWWLLSPFFIDDSVDDDFATTIAGAAQEPKTDDRGGSAAANDSDAHPGASTSTSAPPKAGAPRLLGSGQFVGLAGHDGSGDAGFFALSDGSSVLRFENFDIENGPDLRLYVMPGAGQTEPGDDSLYLGELRGNVGDQTYELPADFKLEPGDWTVLVWCEAFRVEFVAATVTVG